VAYHHISPVIIEHGGRSAPGSASRSNAGASAANALVRGTGPSTGELDGPGYLDDRPMRTIERWDKPDEQAPWCGVWQRTPSGSTYYVQRERMLYVADLLLTNDPAPRVGEERGGELSWELLIDVNISVRDSANLLMEGGI
jgi:hypothetical protein